jgi:hypothetical protein
MEPYQRFEDEMLDAVQEETEAIAAAVSAGNPKALRKGLINYHRRRVRLVPELIGRGPVPLRNHRGIRTPFDPIAEIACARQCQAHGV